MLKTVLVGAVALAVSAGASAASFDFTGLNGQNNNSSITVSSDDGTISAVATAPGEKVGAFSLDGFGVKSNCCDSRAIGNNETLTITFSETVDLGDLHLRQFEGPDSLLLTWDTGSMVLNDGTASINEHRTVNLSGVSFISLTGQGFLTQATLAGLNNVSAVSEVPVPAAAWLFGSALLGLAGAKRKRA